MRGLCTLLAVWLGVLAGLAAVHHHPSTPAGPGRATSTGRP
ncbi:hypothetical protein V2S66_31520 [Streptomyces sp. V4-01]|uniref:Uncharacterized protein n=1 Tax=Actinacidiphila polyblastidii TaxID=3110430 RepID=A0ABU7PKW2_9ACTN|nr:hypothetical protein [Streptomyces sp. V4-01]